MEFAVAEALAAAAKGGSTEVVVVIVGDMLIVIARVFAIKAAGATVVVASEHFSFLCSRSLSTNSFVVRVTVDTDDSSTSIIL